MTTLSTKTHQVSRAAEGEAASPLCCVCRAGLLTYYCISELQRIKKKKTPLTLTMTKGTSLERLSTSGHEYGTLHYALKDVHAVV